MSWTIEDWSNQRAWTRRDEKGKFIVGHRHLPKDHRRKISKSLIGIKRSESTKEKMSKSKIGIKFTKEHRKKISKRLIGNQHALGSIRTKEEKENLSKSLMGNKNGLGYRHTEEAKRRISVANKNHWERKRIKWIIRKVRK